MRNAMFSLFVIRLKPNIYSLVFQHVILTTDKHVSERFFVMSIQQIKKKMQQKKKKKKKKVLHLSLMVEVQLMIILVVWGAACR